MRTLSALGFALATAAAAQAGCMHGNAKNAGTSPTMMQGKGSTACALAELNGVNATVTDVHNGVAITFVAPEEEREKLREAVRDMAAPRGGAAVDVFAGCGCAPQGASRAAAAGAAGAAATTGSPRAAGGSASMQPVAVVVPASTKETDTATGAVLVLRARTDAEGAALTTAVREKMAAMRDGCH
jgi:hypothetical protein